MLYRRVGAGGPEPHQILYPPEGAGSRNRAPQHCREKILVTQSNYLFVIERAGGRDFLMWPIYSVAKGPKFRPQNSKGALQ
jgi:hypothetical protein